MPTLYQLVLIQAKTRVKGCHNIAKAHGSVTRNDKNNNVGNLT